MEFDEQNNTLLFGVSTEKPEAKSSTEAPETKTVEPKVEKPTDTQQPKETSTEKKVEDKKDTQPKETTKDVKGKDVQTQSKDNPENKDDQKPSLKINFGGEQPKTDKKTEQKPSEETRSVTETEVLSFLKNKGVEVQNISDLSKKETLNEQVEKFKKYNEETGRGIKDFYNLQRDWNKESKETRIAEYLKITNPNLSEEDISTQLELVSVTEDDEMSMSEKELKKAKLDFNKLDAEALSFLAQKSKEYAVPKGQAHQAKPPTAEQIAESHKPYWTARDSSLNKLNEVSFNIDGLGEIKIPVDEDDKKFITQNTETLDSFINRWKDGDSLNTERLVEDTLWSNPNSRQKMIQAIVEQSHALTLDNFSKENRNVNLNGVAPTDTVQNSNSGLIIEGGNQQAEKDKIFGNPII